MRAVLPVFLVALSACAADTFESDAAVNADAGDASDAAAPDAPSVDAPNETGNPCPYTGTACGTEGLGGCTGGAACCIEPTLTSCTPSSATCSGDMLACLEPSDCTANGNVCCLMGSTNVACPHVVASGATSACTPTAGCVGAATHRLCTVNADCPLDTACKQASLGGASFGLCN